MKNSSSVLHTVRKRLFDIDGYFIFGICQKIWIIRTNSLRHMVNPKFSHPHAHPKGIYTNIDGKMRFRGATIHMCRCMHIPIVFALHVDAL